LFEKKLIFYGILKNLLNSKILKIFHLKKKLNQINTNNQNRLNLKNYKYNKKKITDNERK